MKITATASFAKKQGHYLILGLLLLIQTMILGHQAWQASPTSDEPVHLLSGYMALEYGHYGVDPEHPALAKMWAALPLLLQDIKLPYGRQELQQTASNFYYDSRREAGSYAHDWIYASDSNPRELLLWPRLMMSIWALFLTISIYYIGSQWFSQTIGLLAAFFTALEPNLLAHGSLVNTDVPITLMFLWVIYSWNLILQNYKRTNLLLWTIAISGAFLTKYSTISLGPLLILIWILSVFKNNDSLFNLAVWRRLATIAAWTIAGLYVSVWVLYGLPLSGVDVASYNPLKDGQDYWINEIRGFEWLFFPVDYMKGLYLVLRESLVLIRPSYLWGEYRYGSFWYYYPVVYLIKTPLSFLLLFFTTLAAILWRLWHAYKNLKKQRLASWGKTKTAFWRWFIKKLNQRWYEIVLLVIVVGFFLITMRAHFNIGIRHLFPVYPFIFLLVSRFVVTWARSAIFVVYQSRLVNKTDFDHVPSLQKNNKQLSKKNPSPANKLILMPFKTKILAMLLFLSLISYAVSAPWWIISSNKNHHYPILISYMSGWVDQKEAWKIIADSNLDWRQNAYFIDQDIRLLSREIKEELYCHHWWYSSIFDLLETPCTKFYDSDQADGKLVLVNTAVLQNPDYHFLWEAEPEFNLGMTIWAYRW